jgi:hypothetical protein
MLKLGAEYVRCNLSTTCIANHNIGIVIISISNGRWWAMAEAFFGGKIKIKLFLGTLYLSRSRYGVAYVVVPTTYRIVGSKLMLLPIFPRPPPLRFCFILGNIMIHRMMILTVIYSPCMGCPFTCMYTTTAPHYQSRSDCYKLVKFVCPVKLLPTML